MANFSNQSKNSTSVTNQVRGFGSVTWDEATFTWDEANGTWDDPRDPWDTQDKNNSTFNLQTKN